MELKVLNWNIGGAKVLEQITRGKREKEKKVINRDLQRLIKANEPDVVTLQEVIAYKQPSDKKVIHLIEKDIIDKLGYKCFFFPLIDSLGFSSQEKWKKVTDKSDWEENTYFSQGNGILLRKNAPLFPFWDLSKSNQTSPGERLLSIYKQHKINPVDDLIKEFDNDFQNYLIERVHLEKGVYFGDRNTEPRVALITHLILDSPLKNDSRPIDVFILNVHLVTIMKERVGIPSKDAEATKLRLNQLDAIFDGIISRYNSWFDDGFPHRGEKRIPETWETFERHQPVWLLCGDFNFTENSDEYDYIMRRNFIDTTPGHRRIAVTHHDGVTTKHSGTKTSGAGNPATLTLDYIFAGPKFVTFDPLFTDAVMDDNRIDHNIKSSDHYPIISKIPLYMIR